MVGFDYVLFSHQSCREAIVVNTVDLLVLSSWSVRDVGFSAVVKRGPSQRAGHRIVVGVTPMGTNRKRCDGG
jgi:hypothetical protein